MATVGVDTGGLTAQVCWIGVTVAWCSVCVHCSDCQHYNIGIIISIFIHILGSLSSDCG